MNGPAAEVDVDRLAAAETGKVTKRVLRNQMRERRGRVAPTDAVEAGERAAVLLDRLLDRPPGGWPHRPMTWALLYASLPCEIDTRPIEACVRRRGMSVAFPRVAGDVLAIHRAAREELRPAGRFSILEPPAAAPPVQPADLDLVIVPGLAFDAAGGRLGYGRGYYDRLLAGAAGAVRVAPCMDWQLVDAVPCDPHDQLVDYLLVAGPDGHLLPTRAAARLTDDRPKENP